MANLGTYGANALLDGTAIPATLWVQLHIGDPTADGDANIAANDGRRSFTRDAAVAGVTQNAALLEWLSSVADEDLTHVSIHDASTAGNCWFVDAINGAPIAAITGQAIEIPLGLLTFTMPIWS